MTDLRDLETLIRVWREYTARNPVPDEFTRAAGYLAGLTLCADQLDETLKRMRADA
jgi:hypothetical protein